MTERLSRMTPSAAGLDRDALLFAAGQRSARSRLWPAIVALLAISQVVTLVVLWPSDSAPPIDAPQVLGPTPAFEWPATSPSADIWSAGSRPDVLQSNNPPADSEFVSSGPPLTVASSRRFDW